MQLEYRNNDTCARSLMLWPGRPWSLVACHTKRRGSPCCVHPETWSLGSALPAPRTLEQHLLRHRWSVARCVRPHGQISLEILLRSCVLDHEHTKDASDLLGDTYLAAARILGAAGIRISSSVMGALADVDVPGCRVLHPYQI